MLEWFYGSDSDSIGIKLLQTVVRYPTDTSFVFNTRYLYLPDGCYGIMELKSAATIN